jgi:hypothetical protein
MAVEPRFHLAAAWRQAGGDKGKTALIDFAARKGKIEDLLKFLGGAFSEYEVEHQRNYC